MSRSQSTVIDASVRRYDIDAVRVLAFAILIFYHSGMFYVLDWGWHVKSQYQAEWLQVPMIFFNQWRMSLLFVISGIATWYLFNKQGVGYLKARFGFIGLPLIFGMVLVVVPQAWFEALAKGDYQGGYVDFWLSYLGVTEWGQAEGFKGSDYDLTWNHLWYLPYLLFYSLLIVPLAWLIKHFRHPVQNFLDKLPIIAWYAGFMLPLMLLGIYLFPHFPYMDHSLFNDWYAHGMYFTFFVLGYVLMSSQQIWQRLSDARWYLLIAASVSFVLFCGFNWNLPEDAHWLLTRAFTLTIYSNRFLWIVTILAMAYTYLNRRMHWLPYASAAVFCWYILHQSITVSAGALLSPLALGPILEPILVVGITVLGCFVIHHCVVRPLKWLHPLFGYKEKTAREPTQFANGANGTSDARSTVVLAKLSN